jgi:hypothetical protein
LRKQKPTARWVSSPGFSGLFWYTTGFRTEAAPTRFTVTKDVTELFSLPGDPLPDEPDPEDDWTEEWVIHADSRCWGRTGYPPRYW